MSHSIRLRSLAVAFAGAALLAFSSGCYSEAGVQPAYVQATSAPVGIDTALRTDYEGRTVYYVEHRWYAHDRGQWVYYRCEPQLLRAQRAQLEQDTRSEPVAQR